MAAFNKVDTFVDHLVTGIHAAWLSADTDALEAYLSNATPSASADVNKADLAEITTAGGYTAGGMDVQNAASQTGAIITVTATDVVVTATGAVDQFRYVPLFNETAANDPLIGWWDYGSALDMVADDTFTINFGASLCTVQ